MNWRGGKVIAVIGTLFTVTVPVLDLRRTERLPLSDIRRWSTCGGRAGVRLEDVYDHCAQQIPDTACKPSKLPHIWGGGPK